METKCTLHVQVIGTLYRKHKLQLRIPHVLLSLFYLFRDNMAGSTNQILHPHGLRLSTMNDYETYLLFLLFSSELCLEKLGFALGKL